MSRAHPLKRAFDLALAGGGLIVAAPFMATIAAAIRLDSRGGAIFRQSRIGYRGETFDLLKFRTMVDAPIRYNPDGSTRIDPADDRVTRVGRHLRGALDELPQLLNVVRGEMSVVGPRPEMATQRGLYRPGDERKLEILPGITGLAVVLGRNEIPWKQRVAIDIWYVEHWSMALDLQIIAQTLLMPLGVHAFDFAAVRHMIESHGAEDPAEGPDASRS